MTWGSLLLTRSRLVDEVASRDAARRLLFGGADVDVDLGAGAAGAGVTHFPEVVVLVAQQDAVRGQVLQPGVAGFRVQGGAVLGAALEHGRIQQAGIDAVDLRQELPGPVDGLRLEIVAEAPVAEHLEHRVVVGIVSDFLEVVVLAADPQAFLRVGRPLELRRGIAQEDVLELVHAGIGKHERGVVLDHHRCGGHDRVPLGSEEIQEFLSYLF